jgi:hypothetical protein
MRGYAQPLMRRRLRAPSLAPHLPFAACAAGLTAATWLYRHYHYPVWPQPGFLDYVLRYQGEFTNDWQTSQPAGHWFFTHALGLLPHAGLEPALVAIWIASLLVLWSGFLSICRALAMPLSVALAAGLVAIGTGFSGFGATQFLLDFVYPRMTAFAFAIAALAALLHRRWALGGGFLGLSVLFHPGVGALYSVAILGGLVATQRLDRSAALRIALPATVFAAPAVVESALHQASESGVSSHELYELATVVTTPQHYLYTEFPRFEYIFVGAWVVVLAAGLSALRGNPAVRTLGAAAIVAALVCLAGAIAGEVGWPVVLVIIQTSYLSPLFVALGVILGAALLAQRAGIWAAPALLAIVLLTRAADELFPPITGLYASWGGTSAFEAGLLLVALGLASFARTRSPRGDGDIARVGRTPALAPAAFAVLLVGSVIAFATREVVSDNPSDTLSDVSEEAHRVSGPSDVFLTPPATDGFRSWARRATVVELGTVQYGKGLDEWRRRMIATTGNPEAVDPDLGTDTAARVALINESYDHLVATSRLPVCRYRARFVLAGADVPAPPWLDRIYENEQFQLFAVKAGTCPRPDQASLRPGPLR